MRLIPLVMATLAAGLSACATTDPIAPSPPAAQAEVSTGQDCAVFAAIAREHYRFAENPPPPLWANVREEDGGLYSVQCDWPRLGVPMSGAIYEAENPAPGRPRWVRFERPDYLGARAIVATGIRHDTQSGRGYECEVVSGVVGWTVTTCRDTWIS